jgi:hypothetical protein
MMIAETALGITFTRSDRPPREVAVHQFHGIGAPTPPTLGASAAEITRYYTEHHSGTLGFLFATVAPLFAIWAGALAARLRDAEGEGAWLYLAFLAGVTVTLAVDVCASRHRELRVHFHRLWLRRLCWNGLGSYVAVSIAMIVREPVVKRV